jgi:4-alpha-glucanotransferase
MNREWGALCALARECGVQPAYRDMAGRERRVSPEALLGVLGALGIGLGTPGEARAVLEELRAAHRRNPARGLGVVWLRRTRVLRVPVPEGWVGSVVRGRWVLEPGVGAPRGWSRECGWGSRVERGPGGGGFCPVPVPVGLPAGYHVLEGRTGSREVRLQVVATTERCYAPRGGGRGWGLFAPLYGLHSGRSVGTGDYRDLRELTEWVGGLGGGLVGTLPLLPVFLESPCEPSPYSPVTRLGWNEFYLDLEAVPELAVTPKARRLMDSPGARRLASKWRRSGEVAYGEVMAFKRAVLECLSRRFFTGNSERRDRFERFMARHPRVADYARFRAVGERFGVGWERWPARMRGGDLRVGDARLEVERLHAYGQWLAREQLEGVALRARELGVGLYLDMPLGTHRDGYDAWRYREVFAPGASGGAPPDPVFTRGQDWGFAPLHPVRSRGSGHEYVVAYLRHHLRQAGMLRIDHVMGLHRLWWVPQGMPASEGAYVGYPEDEFYAILALESWRHRAAIVGEDLGTVPLGVGRRLRRHRVLGLFVAQYEFRGPPRCPLRRVPDVVVASLNTHDMPPFHAWWLGLDVEDRVALGLLGERAGRLEWGLRRRIQRSLSKWLRRSGVVSETRPTVESVLAALLVHLGSSDARWLMVNVEDLWLETASQNVPGTSTERANWRRKLRRSVEAMRGDGPLAAWLAQLGRLRRRRGVVDPGARLNLRTLGRKRP